MDERLNLRLDKERFDFIEKYRVENSLDNNSEALRLIISDRIEFENSILTRIKKIFF